MDLGPDRGGWRYIRWRRIHRNRAGRRRRWGRVAHWGQGCVRARARALALAVEGGGKKIRWREIDSIWALYFISKCQNGQVMVALGLLSCCTE
jgi:hypothetical protein